MLDVEYVRHASLWLDVKILLWTFVCIVGFSGKWAKYLLGLDRPINRLAATYASPEPAAGSDGIDDTTESVAPRIDGSSRPLPSAATDLTRGRPR